MSEPPPPNAEHEPVRPAFRADTWHRIVPNEERSRAQDLLREIPVFRDVPPHHLRELARFAHSEAFAAGQTIIRKGEVGSTMHVIRSGRVQVLQERPGADALALATLGPGEYFGELAIFDSETRSATVLAVEDTVTVAIGHIEIVRLVTRSPELALSLLKSLSARVRQANDRLSANLSESPSA